jgi:hypothetical protein
MMIESRPFQTTDSEFKVQKFKVPASRILSFEGSAAKITKDPSLRLGQAWNIEP